MLEFDVKPVRESVMVLEEHLTALRNEEATMGTAQALLDRIGATREDVGALALAFFLIVGDNGQNARIAAEVVVERFPEIATRREDALKSIIDVVESIAILNAGGKVSHVLDS